MTPDSPIMMPMQPDAAAQQMLIEQVRRLSESVDRFNTTMSKVQQQLARMEVENRHTVERRERNEAWISKVENRVGELETWRSEQKGERSMLAAFLGSPIVGWIGGAVIAFFAAVKGGLVK
jgi:predicted RNase H-like nuclease (RuvC/YqgF family)